MSVDMMERLKAMLGDAPKAKSEPKPKSEPKAKVAKVESKPEPTVAELQTAAMGPDGPTVPIVVLDDGSTFSNLRGCKVCFADPAAEEIDATALSAGIEISDLLTLRDAVRTILRIVG